MVTLRDHAVALAKEAFVMGMRAFHEQQAKAPDSVRLSRRQHFAARLARVRPGAAGTIQAVETHTGAVEEEP